MREPRDEFAAQDSYVFWLLSFSPYFRMGEFVLGSLIAQLYMQLRDRKVGALENALGTAAFIAAIISVFNMASRLLTSRPALLLGDASYSIYLTHFLVLMVDFKLFGPPAQSGTAFNIVVLGATVVTTLVLSIGLYAYYEAPARKWLRQLWRGSTVR